MAAIVALACALLLAVRFVVLPQVDSHRAEIASFLSRELDQVVEIDSIATRWDGWNPEVSINGLRVRDRSGGAALPLLELPSVTGLVSWTSILLAELHFKELAIERPRLAVRRDTAGRIHIAGIEIDPSAAMDDSHFVEWLLRQRSIVVRDALVTWNDDLRNAPQLVLDRVELRLVNRFGRHRIGLTGLPPAEIASPVDLRADLAADSFRDWRRANGELYVRVDYADVAAWREWLPLPVPIERGKGALRTWFEFSQGDVGRMVADLELEDVRAKLAPDLAALDLSHLAGRLSWNRSGAEREVTTRALSFAVDDGPPLAPVDLRLAYRLDAAGETESGEAYADRVSLDPLAAVAAHLPLPRALRDAIERHAPRGELANVAYQWKGRLDAPRVYRFRGEARDVATRAIDAIPGFSGLSGAIDATEAGGTIRIDSRGASVEVPRVLAQTIPLEIVTGEARWDRARDGLSVRGTLVNVGNADATLSATFAWQSRPKGPGVIDLDAKVSRADAKQIERYLPIDLAKNARTWIVRAIRDGTASEGRVVLKGDLAEFPFADGRRGQFLVTAKVRGAKLDYAEHWPPIEGIDAELRFQGARLTIAASSGSCLGATIRKATADIDDLRNPRLRVQGEAAGPTAQFLAFVAQSPVAGWTEHATQGFDASGDGSLALSLDLSLVDNVSKVSGEFRLLSNQLRVPDLPLLTQVTGTVMFNDGRLQASDVGFATLGGAWRANLEAAEGRVAMNAEGTAKAEPVRAYLESSLLDRASGATDWKVAFERRRDGPSRLVLESTLKGLAIDLPEPAGKPADSSVPLRIDRSGSLSTGRERILADYGRVARVVADRRAREGQFAVERALVLVGNSVARGGEPDRPGIVVRGELDAINADDWIGLLQQTTPAGTHTGAARLEVASVDVAAREFEMLGRSFHAMNLGARRAGGDWKLSLASEEVEGNATWEARSARFPNGRVVARLSRLALPGPGEMTSWQGASHEPAVRAESDSNPWPEIDLVADHYIGKRGDLGRLEMAAKPMGADWRIDKLTLVNDAGTLAAEGWWRSRGRDQQTRLDVSLDVKDAGAYLTRFGVPDALRGAPTKIDGQLSWSGSPDEFDYPTLDGSFNVTVGPGQFTKIEPGIGKLIGVLSLQALPRRITLDFRDVFSEGFAFDAINGHVRIGSGVMHTENLQLNGPAAKVLITGDVDLKQETQRLTVHVQPSLASSVSAGAAAAVLLAANPIIGAAVGAGTLLAQKMMKDPIEQMFSYEYLVRGSWDEPLVDRVTRRLETSAEAGKAGAGSR